MSGAPPRYADGILMKMTSSFLHVIAAISLLAVGDGCGGTSGGTGGGSTASTSSTGTGTTTTSPVPTAQAAWSVTTEQPDGSACPIAAGTQALGQVTASTKTMILTNGTGGAAVTCSVLGSGPFEVDATASDASIGLQISIPAITASATAAAPAPGTVSLNAVGASPDGGPLVLYTGSCSFYFVPSTPEAVTAGSVWVAFTCPGLTNTITMDTCPVTESYALFESCVSGT